MKKSMFICDRCGGVIQRGKPYGALVVMPGKEGQGEIHVRIDLCNGCAEKMGKKFYDWKTKPETQTDGDGFEKDFLEEIEGEE